MNNGCSLRDGVNLNITKMNSTDIFIFLVIHLLVPLAGLIFFMGLLKKMKTAKTANETVVALFIIFATYGGLLLLTLTTLFWKWSAMASLGTFYLIIGAPIVMAIIAYRHRRTRKIGKYYKWTFNAAMYYFVIAPAVLTLLLVVSDK
jgi:hypothetical protein